ncbi:MAG: dTDP-4-dehydrorhamnose reductase [Sphingobium sp.]|nr:dTDP-4-dehydrorhamnose reductase [Sphingobium sp.]MBP6111866.1 dTDP-4-dehydrorhamnose reductase [Sphingobium sp.]MBP8669808.1 dTDP-4-dehydrorhamnose reductase [Sphingobium sp.]MBP9156432.1 dTDP-4-dehydrorhamnose reductase [Sphingobium sp.]MCC6482688.1 dTDP-4-dehydrorhamnose reductase [Sphingomonadaceae bacterium]
MKALITGANGQLGQSLQHTAPEGAELICTDIAELDICDATAVDTFVAQHRPDLILNAAAYTAVDKAESEEELALRINAEAVSNLAVAARANNARFVHVSTDFVFDGLSGVPYQPTDTPAPVSAYGRTKLAGEQAAGVGALIVRTAWVYAPKGNNFVRTMLRLMAERDEVRVVADQIGTPTYAPDLAAALWALSAKGITGIHHYTDSGAASWYDFAVAIQEEALAEGLLSRTVPIIPINTTDYPTPAIRPHYSVLDKSSTFSALGCPAPHWRANLRKMIQEIKTHG